MKDRTEKQRSSNIELLRIVAIIFVITVHMTFGATGLPGQTDSYSVPSLFVEALTIIGVNLFVLISGYFSICLKRKTVVNLLFICLFYGFIKVMTETLLNGFSFNLLLFVSNSNWFIVAYLGLMIVSPILNSFVNSCDKKQLQLTILLLLTFQLWFGNTEMWTNKSLAYGYSLFSLGVLYLIGRYLKLYGIPRWLCKYSMLIYVLASICAGVVALLLLKSGISGKLLDELILRVYSYNNIFFIISSIAFFAYFAEMKMHHLKVVNWLAQSSLAVLLVHTIPSVQTYLQQTFKVCVWSDFSLRRACLGGGIILIIYACSVLFDQIRILIYNKVILQCLKRKKH